MRMVTIEQVQLKGLNMEEIAQLLVHEIDQVRRFSHSNKKKKILWDEARTR